VGGREPARGAGRGGGSGGAWRVAILSQAYAQAVFTGNLQSRNTAAIRFLYSHFSCNALLTGRVDKGRLRGAPGCPYFFACPFPHGIRRAGSPRPAEGSEDHPLTGHMRSRYRPGLRLWHPAGSMIGARRRTPASEPGPRAGPPAHQCIHCSPCRGREFEPWHSLSCCYSFIILPLLSSAAERSRASNESGCGAWAKSADVCLRGRACAA
jgi:hypothetical protein